ncbi:MAG: LuxR C-terminal-related transcriptional regulator [Chloroflexota bacterium]
METPLSPQELQLLSLLIDGMSNKQIACRLEIAERTVEFHVGNVLKKLEVSSRTEAAVKAVRLGLLEE